MNFFFGFYRAYDDLKPLCAESGEIKLYYLNELQKTFFTNEFKPSEIEYLWGYMCGYKISPKKPDESNVCKLFIVFSVVWK